MKMIVHPEPIRNRRGVLVGWPHIVLMDDDQYGYYAHRPNTATNNIYIRHGHMVYEEGCWLPDDLMTPHTLHDPDGSIWRRALACPEAFFLEVLL